MVLRPEEVLEPPQAVEEASRAAAPGLRPLLLPYQQRWVADASPGKVCVKSRRIGISWAAAIEAVFCAARGRGVGSDVWYMCQSERDAKQFIRDAGRFTRQVNAGLLKRGKAPIVADVSASIMVTRIQFTSGHVVEILPGKNPDAIRGKGGYVIFDESALLDVDACREAADALQNDMKGGRVAFISTQRGEGNAFNKLVESIRRGDLGTAGYALHQTSLREAIAEGFYRRTCQIRGVPHSLVRERLFYERCMAKPGAAQEFDCVPAREGEQYFARDLVEQAMRHKMVPIRWQLPAGWEIKEDEGWRRRRCEEWIRVELRPHLERLCRWERHTLGWDFGRSPDGDLSAAAPMALGGGVKRRVPWVVELTGVPFNQQRQIMHALIDGLPNFDGAAFDKGGNGAALAEWAKQAYGERSIDEVALSRPWYERNVSMYKADLQSGELGLPWYADLLVDHEVFELDDSVPMPSKKRRRGSQGGKRHGDAAVACVLAHSRSRGRATDWGVAESVPSGREVGSW